MRAIVLLALCNKIAEMKMTKQTLDTMVELTDAELYAVGGGDYYGNNFAAVYATQLNLAYTSVSGDYSSNYASVYQSNSISVSQS
jgi:hypothetical protein